jgi:hypothetical protein
MLMELAVTKPPHMLIPSGELSCPANQKNLLLIGPVYELDGKSSVATYST